MPEGQPEHHTMDHSTEKINLRITDVESPDRMLAREIPGSGMSDEAQQFKKLMHDINKEVSSQKSNILCAEHGKIYIGRRQQDKRWYRIKILEQINRRTYRCYMLDDDDTEKFTLDWIFVAPEKYLRVPFQVKTYAIAGVKPLTLKTGADLFVSMQPTTVWDPSARIFIMEQLKESPKQRAEVLYVDDSGVVYIRLYVNKGSQTICLNDALIEKGYGYASSMEDQVAPRNLKWVRGKTLPNTTPDRDLQPSKNKATRMGREGHANHSPDKESNPPEPGGNKSAGAGSKSMYHDRGSQGTTLHSDSDKETSPGKSQALGRGGGRGLALMKTLGNTADVKIGHGPVPGGAVQAKPAALGRGMGRGRGTLTLLEQALKEAGLSDSGLSEDDRKSTHKTTTVAFVPAVKSVSPAVETRDSDIDHTVVAGEGWTLSELETSGDDMKGGKNRGSTVRAVPETKTQRLPEFGLHSLNKAIPIPKWTASDSDSGVVGRLPNFVKKAKRASSEKIKEVTFSDGEELLGPRSSVDQSNGSPRSILKVRSDSDVSSKSGESPQPTAAPITTEEIVDTERCLSAVDTERCLTEETEMSRSPMPSSEERSSRDSSPEREDSIPLSGCHRHHLSYLMGRESGDNTIQPPQHSASELRVLVDGGTPPQHIPQPSAIFGESICNVLDRHDIEPTTVQKFSWHTFMRGRNFVSVSCPYRLDRGGGTTYAYLLPLLQNLLQKSLYSGVPAGVGPLALILCSSWRRVHTVYNQVAKLLGQDLCIRTVEIYGGGSESNQEIRLINGCDLLIATPRCLLRLVARAVVELKRICHLILDDGDNIMERYSDEVQNLMTQYTDTLAAVGTWSAPQQFVVATAHWTPGLQAFLDTYMTDAGVIIASMTEATIYTRVDKVVHVVQNDQRASKLAALLASSVQKRTLIFTNSPDSAKAVHDMLTNYGSIYCLLLHEDMPHHSQKDMLGEWKQSVSANSPPVMVVTDEVGPEVEDAEIVIHYDPPKRKQDFGSRLWCMNHNFILPLQPSEERKGAVSILLVTDSWQDYVNLVIKDLKNSGMVVPNALIKLADTIKSSKEQGKYTELCSSFKAYGFCGSENRCKERHTVQHELDSQGAQEFHQVLPTRGQVKVFVTCVRDASCCWVRLMEHSDQGKVTDHSKDFMKLAFALPTHYSEVDNRVPCITPEVGDLCVIRDIQQNYSRVKILKIKRHIADKHLGMPFQKIEKVQVRMVDIGRTLWVDQHELLHLHSKFRSYPFQAVEVFVCGVKPFDGDEEWTFQATDHITSAVAEHQLEGRIVLTLGNTLWLDPLVRREVLKEVGVVAHDVVCHRELLDNNFGLSNPEHIRMLYKVCRGQIDLPEILSLKDIPNMAYDMYGLPTSLQNAVPQIEGYEASVYVEVTAVVHPGILYVRLTENSKKLEKLHYEILDYVRITEPKPEAMKLMQPGSLVLTTFPFDEDGEDRPWYRGKVMGVQDDKYDVFLLDSGESEFIDKDQVRPMPVTFKKLPFQAVECSLANLLPPSGDEWGEDVGEILWKMVTNEENKSIPLLMEVVRQKAARHFGTYMYDIRLFNIELEFDVDISQELIVEGHARPSAALVTREIPGLFDGQTCDVPGLCVDILLDQSVAAAKARDLQRSLLTGMNDNLTMLCESRAVGAIAQTIGYLSNAVITEILCKLIVLLVRNNSEVVVQALIRDDGISNLCRMLSRRNADVRKVATWTIGQIIQNGGPRKTLIERGALRLLASRLEDPENNDNQAKEYAVQALSYLSESVNEGSRMIVLRSECIQALSHHLETATDSGVIIKTVDTLKQFMGNVKIQEESRPWAIGVLCSKLEEHMEDGDMADHISAAIVTLAAGSRINKEALLQHDILHLMKTLVQSGKLSGKSQKQTENLCETLTAIRQASENGVDREKLIDDSDVVSQKKEKVKNRPLQKEELDIITHSMRPQINWFQDRRNLILLVQVKNASKPLNINISEDSIYFRTVVERIEYSFTLQLYELVDPNKCDTRVKTAQVQIGLKKITKGNWPRVIKDRIALPHLVPDFEHFIDESDSESEGEDELVDDDSPLDAIERCKPRPPGLPPPTAEHRKHYAEGTYLPYDPLDDLEGDTPSSDMNEDDDPDERDDHEVEIERNFFNL